MVLEIPAAFGGDTFSIAGEFLEACLDSASTGVGSESKDEVNGFTSKERGVTAANDDGDEESSGCLSLPPFRDGDLNTEALAASCWCALVDPRLRLARH